MFQIITYGGGQFLTFILNGVAAIFGNNDYAVALQVAALLGGLAALCTAALGGRLVDMKWLLIIALIYMLAFVPKVSVTINDPVTRTAGWPLSTQSTTVVSNVPMGLAFTASLTSGFMDWMTTSFQTVFSLPNTISYSSGGPFFAQGLAQSLTAAQVQDPNLNVSLANYWKDCVFIDVGLGFYSLSDLAKASDIESFLAANSAQSRMYQHVAANGATSYQSCSASMSSGGAMDTDLQAEVTRQEQSVALNGDFSTPASNANGIIQAGGAASPVVWQYLTGMAGTEAQILAQATLINSFGNGVNAFANGADSNSVVEGYAAAKAEQERNITFSVMGQVAGKMLPLLNIIALGILYAIAPIVGAMMMLPNSQKVGFAYVQALLWLSLWAPLYAVLHCASLYFEATAVQHSIQMCNAANTCTPSFSLYTMNGIGATMNTAATITGYLATMVPMLAYLVVSRGGAMAAGMVGRVLDGYQQPVSQVAGEAAGGNLQMGNTSMANMTMMQQNVSPSQTVGSSIHNDGAMTTTMTSGGMLVNQAQDNTVINAAVSRARQEAVSQSVERATSHESSAMNSLAQAKVAEFRASYNHSEGGSRTQSGSVTSNSGTATSEDLRNQWVTREAENYAKSQGWSKDQMTKWGAAVEGNLGVGGKIPGTPVSAGASASVGASYTDQTDRNTSQTAQQSAGRGTDMSTVDDTNRSNAVGTASSDMHSATTTDGKDTAALRANSARAEQNYQSALREVDSAKKAQSLVDSTDQRVQLSENTAVTDHIMRSGGNWQKGLNDVARGIDSGDARRVMRAVDDYYQQQSDKLGGLAKSPDQVQGQAADQAAAAIRQAAASDAQQLGQRGDKAVAHEQRVAHGQVHQTGERQKGVDQSGATLKNNEQRTNEEAGINIAWRDDAKAHQKQVADSVHPDDPQ